MKILITVACALLVLAGIILNSDVFAESASELADNTTGWILETTSFFEVKVEHITKDHDEHPELYSMNSEGFRGSEFIKNKPDDTYRIITVGGSTTFGSGVTNENTWPKILEKKLQSISEGKNIEVINAGIPAAASFIESKLIKEKLIHFKPDLIIIFDGNNDTACKMVEHTTKYHNEPKERKIKLCGAYLPDTYDEMYAERWSDICKFGTENGFETVFILQPIPHFGKILTDQEIVNSFFFRAEHPHYLNSLESFAQQLSNIEKHCTKAADFREIFDYYLEPIYFDYVHVGDRGNEIIAINVLELISPILDENGASKVIPAQSNIVKPKQNPEIVLQLYESNWGDLLPNQKNFIAKNLSGKDFSNSSLENEIFFGSDLENANFENSIISGSDFSLANLENANFKNAIIDGIKLRQTTLEQTDFSNVDFRQVNLLNVDLTNTILKNSNLSNKDLTKTFLYKADLSGADLSYSDLSIMYLKDTVLDDANLTGTILYEADLSLTLDTHLPGTVLIGSTLTWANLANVDFSGKNLSGVNFKGSDLTGQNFTNDVSFFGNNFKETELSNADFEGVDLSAKSVIGIFENNSPLKILEITRIFLTYIWYNMIIISTGGDVIPVDFVVINNFADANLENANFTNADLRHTNFDSANLANANFSNANLSNANLDGVNLQGAILDNAILSNASIKCKNHQICLN